MLDCSKVTRLQARLRFIDLVSYAVHLLMMCYGTLVFDVISFYIFVFIAIASFSSAPLVVKGAILLQFVLRFVTIFLSIFFSILPLFWIPVPVVCAILYAYAKSTLGTLDTLDYVFLSLSIVGNVGLVIGILFYKYIIASKLYDEWLLAFSPEWPHDVKLPWVERAQKLSAWRRSIIQRWLD
jgi:hypothetical protein